MPIVDSQVHAYAANTPGRPWDNMLYLFEQVTAYEMVTAMDAVGVDGAIVVSAFTMSGYDAKYAVDIQKAPPYRFGLVKPVDASDEQLGDAALSALSTVGVSVLPVSLHSLTIAKSRPGHVQGQGD